MTTTDLSIVESAAIKFNEAKSMISSLAGNCKMVVITDASSLAYAKDLAKNAKKIEKFIEDKRVEFTKPILDDKKKIDDMAKGLVSDLQQAIKDLRGSILKYEQEQEAIRQAELRRLEDERRKMEEGLRAAVAKDEEITREDILALQELKQQQAEVIAEPVKNSIAKVWDYELVNINVVPLKYLMPDDAKIKAAIKEGERSIQGIKIFQKDRLTLR